MYHRLRFEMYDRVLSTIFQPEVSGTLSVVCAHKRLNGVAMPASLVAPRPGSYLSCNQ
jgi:hypothetical protein